MTKLSKAGVPAFAAFQKPAGERSMGMASQLDWDLASVCWTWHRVGPGRSWGQVCPASWAKCARFCQGIPRQMHAQVPRNVVECRGTPVTAYGRARQAACALGAQSRLSHPDMAPCNRSCVLTSAAGVGCRISSSYCSQGCKCCGQPARTGLHRPSQVSRHSQLQILKLFTASVLTRSVLYPDPADCRASCCEHSVTLKTR